MIKKIVVLSVVFFSTIILSACVKDTVTQELTNAADVATGVAAVKIKEQADKNLAIAKAKELWRIQFQLEQDLSAGPCLSNNLIADWVADIAHNPRLPIDDQPVNQCNAFTDGTAKHFVELDAEGNLIRAE